MHCCNVAENCRPVMDGTAMIPGISTVMEGLLARCLQEPITDLRPEGLNARQITLFAASDPEAQRLGIEFNGGPDLTIAVTDPNRRIGTVRVQTGGANSLMFFDNADRPATARGPATSWAGNLQASIRMLGPDCLCFFNAIGAEYVALENVLMRSDTQLLYWGIGASAVGLSIELEGSGKAVLIGDDALISNGVWIRNYDMHSMHDLRSAIQINKPAENTVLERHVWLGQDALLLGCRRIGRGSIVGARALVKGTIPSRVAVGGIPARVLRDEVSWGRHPYEMSDAERLAIGRPE